METAEAKSVTEIPVFTQGGFRGKIGTVLQGIIRWEDELREEALVSQSLAFPGEKSWKVLIRPNFRVCSGVMK
jgi:hypothetical protein